METEEYLFDLFDLATQKPPGSDSRVVKNGCIHCGAKLIERYVCDECHCGQGRMIAFRSLEDSGRVGPSKPDYNRVENFRKVIDRFQARQNIEIPLVAYARLKEAIPSDSSVTKRESLEMR